MARRPVRGIDEAFDAILSSVVLGLACLVTFLLVDRTLSHLLFISRSDDLLGAMWAVIATIFVFRDSYQKSVSAAISRMAATVVSFVVCLIYLSVLPFHVWGLAALIGVSALAVTVIGRADDAITASVTTAVVLVVAAVDPHDAWQQPILRLIDTVIGVVVGLGAAWLALRLGTARGTRGRLPVGQE